MALSELTENSDNVAPETRNGTKCPKCGKRPWARIEVERVNRYGVTYRYERYTHPDSRKKDRRRYCFIHVSGKQENGVQIDSRATN